MPLCREKFFRFFSEIFVVLSLLILILLVLLVAVLILLVLLILLIAVPVLLVLLIPVLILLILIVHDFFLPNVRLPFKNFRKVPLCRRQCAENAAP